MRMRTRTALLAALAVVALAVAAGAAVALISRDDDGDASREGFRLVQRRANEFARSPVAGKLDFRLASLATFARRAGRADALARARAKELETRRGRVRVVVEVAPGGRRLVGRAIRAADGSIEARYGDLVQALIPPAALSALALTPGVSLVRPPVPSTPDAPIVGEGLAATKATAWHARDFTGAGVTVAVIDVGFKGYRALLGGELPASASVTAQDFCSGNLEERDHGTAVAEIVHEVAPRARLLLLCVGSEVQLGQAYVYARRENAHIVTQSRSWFAEGRGDGTGEPTSPAGIVADARRNGILWVNSAGNRADREHWHGTFNDSDGDGFHNFADGDNSNTIDVSRNVCVVLKWDDWPRSSEDYNLELTPTAEDEPVDGSRNPQRGQERPVEQMCFEPDGFGGSYDVKIARLRATRPVRMDLFAWPISLQYAESASSVTEPGSSPNVLAVGAICWRGDALPAYSSRGPTIDGRVKPDLAAPTSVSSATSGPFLTCDRGGFRGTSASTPHVAGVAALVKQRFPAATPDQLQAYLEQNAADLGIQGKDNDTGAGKLVLPAP
jgi:subtilisin family serine protease